MALQADKIKCDKHVSKLLPCLKKWSYNMTWFTPKKIPMMASSCSTKPPSSLTPKGATIRSTMLFSSKVAVNLFWERADQCFIGKCWLQHINDNTVYLLLCILVIAWTGQWITTVSFDTDIFFPFEGEFKTIKHCKFKSDHQHILSTRLWVHFKQSYLKKQLV